MLATNRYRLVNSHGVALRSKLMTEAQALIANRDLWLAGEYSVGWMQAAPRAPRAEPRAEPRPQPSADLVAALVAIGYSKSKAKELAATAPAGTVDQQLTAIFTKQRRETDHE